MLISLASFFTVGSKICFLGDIDNIKLFHQQIHGYPLSFERFFFLFLLNPYNTNLIKTKNE
jgi:hypothetical protein